MSDLPAFIPRATQRRHALLLSLGWQLSNQANDWWKSPHTGHEHCSEVAEKLEKDRAGKPIETFEPSFPEEDPTCINNMGSEERRKPGRPPDDTWQGTKRGGSYYRRWGGQDPEEIKK